MDPTSLVAAAIAARAHAYAPYSHFRVGAALLLADGRVFTGVNVENASYPLAVCAERNAIGAAVLAGLKPGDLRAIAVAADSDGPVTPCGGCRQVLAEFAPPGTPVHLHNVRDGSTTEHSIAELLPYAFLRDRLP